MNASTPRNRQAPPAASFVGTIALAGLLGSFFGCSSQPPLQALAEESSGPSDEYPLDWPAATELVFENYEGLPFAAGPVSISGADLRSLLDAAATCWGYWFYDACFDGTALVRGERRRFLMGNMAYQAGRTWVLTLYLTDDTGFLGKKKRWLLNAGGDTPCRRTIDKIEKLSGLVRPAPPSLLSLGITEMEFEEHDGQWVALSTDEIRALVDGAVASTISHPNISGFPGNAVWEGRKRNVALGVVKIAERPWRLTIWPDDGLFPDSMSWLLDTAQGSPALTVIGKLRKK